MSSELQKEGARDSSYVFDNAASESQSRMEQLSRIYDEETFRHLTRLGIGPGWKCLDVGAGGGSVAKWMAEQVGLSGHVVATDLDSRYLNAVASPNLEVRQHNIVSDPLETDYYDVAHTRLVLSHIPEREAVLERLIASIVPGGWLLLEEFDSRLMRLTTVRSYDALQLVMGNRGVDTEFGHNLPNLLVDLGLTSVGAKGHAFQWAGGSPFAELMAANFRQVRQAMLDTGTITADEIDADLALLRDSRSLRPSPIMWTVFGRKPAPPNRR
jgi:ubiquinone/menaquinone biosynthesis C-methylase UbiE